MDKKRLLPAIFVVFSNLLGATLILPILPLYAVEQFGGTILQAVLLDMAYYAAKFVAAPVLGQLSDRHGRRPLLLLSQTGTAASFALFLLAVPLGQMLDRSGPAVGLSGGLIVLYLARLLDGFTGGNTSIAQAYVSDITPEDERAQALGWLSAALGLGFILGPALGGILAGLFGLQAPFVAGALVAAFGVMLTAGLLPESLPPTESRPNRVESTPGRHHIGDQMTWRVTVLVGFLVTGCFAAISPIFSLYARQVLFPETVDAATVGRGVGLIFMLMGLIMVLTQGLLLRPLIQRLGERRLIALAALLLSLSFALVPMTDSPWLAALALAPLALAYSAADPSLQALLTRASGAAYGRALGTYQSVLSLAYIIGPLWAGLAFARLGPQSVWQIGAGVLALGFMAALRLFRTTPVAPALN